MVFHSLPAGYIVHSPHPTSWVPRLGPERVTDNNAAPSKEQNQHRCLWVTWSPATASIQMKTTSQKRYLKHGSHGAARTSASSWEQSSSSQHHCHTRERSLPTPNKPSDRANLAFLQMGLGSSPNGLALPPTIRLGCVRTEFFIAKKQAFLRERLPTLIP